MLAMFAVLEDNPVGVFYPQRLQLILCGLQRFSGSRYAIVVRSKLPAALMGQSQFDCGAPELLEGP